MAHLNNFPKFTLMSLDVLTSGTVSKTNMYRYSNKRIKKLSSHSQLNYTIYGIEVDLLWKADMISDDKLIKQR